MVSSYNTVAFAASCLLVRIANAVAAPDPSPRPDPVAEPQQIATASTTPAMNALTPVGCYTTPTATPTLLLPPLFAAADSETKTVAWFVDVVFDAESDTGSRLAILFRVMPVR